MVVGVPDGRPLHELPARVTVPAGHVPVSRGHPGSSVRGVHLWDSVLVFGLFLLLGPAHPSSCFHTSLLQTAAGQRLWGTLNMHTQTWLNCCIYELSVSLTAVSSFLFSLFISSTLLLVAALSFLSMISELNILIHALICFPWMCKCSCLRTEHLLLYSQSFSHEPLITWIWTNPETKRSPHWRHVTERLWDDVLISFDFVLFLFPLAFSLNSIWSCASTRRFAYVGLWPSSFRWYLCHSLSISLWTFCYHNFFVFFGSRHHQLVTRLEFIRSRG